MAVGDPCDICGSPIPVGSWGPTKRCGESCRILARRRRERASYAADPQRRIATVQRYQKRNPDVIHLRSLNRVKQDPTTYRRWFLRFKYGLTIDEYDAMAVAQDGRCAICHRVETKRNNGRTQPLSVDHDHETGAVRGLLCSRCNSMLAFFEDLELHAAATEYLRRHSQRQQEVS